MPYINRDQRPLLDGAIAGFVYAQGYTPGEMNYILTRLLLLWRPPLQSRYEDHQAVIGLLECVKAEYIERVLRPYEDRKLSDNGDVYA